MNLSPEEAAEFAREIIRNRPDDFDERQYLTAERALLIRAPGGYRWAFEVKAAPIRTPNTASTVHWWWITIRGSTKKMSWHGYSPRNFVGRFSRASDLELVAYMGTLAQKNTGL